MYIFQKLIEQKLSAFIVSNLYQVFSLFQKICIIYSFMPFLEIFDNPSFQKLHIKIFKI